jgi:hypothetical protein
LLSLTPAPLAVDNSPKRRRKMKMRRRRRSLLLLTIEGSM